MNDYKQIKVAYLEDTGYIKENFSQSNDKLEVKLVGSLSNRTTIDINNASVYGDINKKEPNYEFFLKLVWNESLPCATISRNWGEYNKWNGSFNNPAWHPTRNFSLNGQNMQVDRCQNENNNLCYLANNSLYDSKGVKCKIPGGYFQIKASKVCKLNKNGKSYYRIKFVCSFSLESWAKCSAVMEENCTGGSTGVLRTRVPITNDDGPNHILFHRYAYPAFPQIAYWESSNKLFITSSQQHLYPNIPNPPSYTIDLLETHPLCQKLSGPDTCPS